MSLSKSQVKFSREDMQWKGSRLRCLLFTSIERGLFSDLFKRIINEGREKPIDIEIPDDFVRYPRGFLNPHEIQIDKAKIPIGGKKDYCEVLNSWWLAKPSSKTPVWDLVCSATIDGKDGFILVEAKAHEGELKEDDEFKAGKDSVNKMPIITALRNINKDCGYNLSTDRHYQMSNRFAWSWKLASEGVPIILIYLGCLNSLEMIGSKIFKDSSVWARFIRDQSEKIGINLWEEEVQTWKRIETTNGEELTKGEKLYPLIRSIDFQLIEGFYEIECEVKIGK